MNEINNNDDDDDIRSALSYNLICLLYFYYISDLGTIVKYIIRSIIFASNTIISLDIYQNSILKFQEI